MMGLCCTQLSSAFVYLFCSFSFAVREGSMNWIVEIESM